MGDDRNAHPSKAAGAGSLPSNWLIFYAVLSILWIFHMIFRDWGLAIIGLVFIVRLLLHPITKTSQIIHDRDGQDGPGDGAAEEEVRRRQGSAEQGDDGVYKEQGMAPDLGCLPMFLQMPIWIALWSALQSTFELRHAPFLFGGIT